MELLLRIVDKPLSGDAKLDAGRTRAGDVIVAMPDGHIWGKQEVINPDWRIVRVSGMNAATADALKAAEIPVVFGQNALLRKRQMTIDLERLNIASGGALLVERSATPRGVDVTVNLSAFVACMSLKPRQTNPMFVGPRKAVRR